MSTSPMPSRAVGVRPGTSPWRALAVLAGGLAMIVLDGTIVGIALPTIIFDLHLGIAESVWVNSVYSMIFAGLLLSAGWLSDRIGRRLQFLIGVGVFIVGSVLAGVAADAGLLIASRAVQGVGGALIMPTTVSTINVLFRGRDRAAAFGIWGAVMSGTAAIGPLLGAALTQYADWRWVFFVNVPLGLVVLVLGALWIPENRGAQRVGFDLAGLVLSAGALSLLVFGLIEGTDLGWWRPKDVFVLGPLTWPETAAVSPVPVALGLGLVMLVAFIVVQRNRARAGRGVILDLGLFALPTFTWGNVAAAMVAVGEFALVFVMPLFLIFVAGLDVLAAGWVLAAMAIGAFASGAAARHLAAALGAASVVVLGLVLEVVGVAATALVLTPSTPAALIAATMAVYGLGLGLAAAQLTSTVMVAVPQAMSGAASAAQSTVRQVGSALGSAVAGTTLAIGLGVMLPVRLAEIPGLPANVPDQVVSATIDSVGALIPLLRSGKGYNTLGEWRLPVGDALAHGFADATAVTLWVAVAFLVLGLLASMLVQRYGRDAHAADVAAEASGSRQP